MLRKGQKELVETYKKGYCGVPAIPGGGKTFALTKWVVEAISSGINKPGKILIVTYMNSAVNNFKQRISAELEEKGINSKDYFVSTIHSLCLQIIKEIPDAMYADEDVEVIDDLNKIHVLKEAINSWKRLGENARLYNYYLDDLSVQQAGYENVVKKWDKAFTDIIENAISEFKINEMTADDAIKLTKTLPVTSFLKVSAQIYKDYQLRLNKRGYIDFGDMLAKAKKILMSNDAILEKFRKKYTYVCEDEAQDSNKLQTDILMLIAGEKGNFLRVGDSNQSILTTFANSDMKLFKDFCEAPNRQIFKIVQSSRNTKQVIDLANKFVDFVRNEHPTIECRESLLPQYIEPVGVDDMYPNPVVNGQAVFTECLKKREEEYEFIAKKCKELIDKDKNKTIAVLIPTKKKIEDFLVILEKSKIKYEYLDNYAGERNKTLMLLGRVLDFVGNPEKSDKLVEVVKELISEEIRGREQLCEYLLKMPTEELFFPMYGEISFDFPGDEIRNTEAWSTFYKYIPLLKDFLNFPFTIIEKLVLYISERFEFSLENRAIAQKVASTVRFLIAEEPRYKVSDLAEELLKPKGMFNYFANLVWELKGYEAKPGTVTVATYHKSKGMEWDNVFLSGLTNDEFPANLQDKLRDEIDYLKPACSNPKSMIKKDMSIILNSGADVDFVKQAKIDIISERARLLYVGITRAKERLFITTLKAGKAKPSIYYNVMT